MVAIIRSGTGGYNRSNTIASYAPPAQPSYQESRFDLGLSEYNDSYVPTTPDAAPTVAPTWQVDWTRDTSLPQQLSLTRTSSASYVAADGHRYNAASNGPRFDWRSNGPVGLLIEAEQRTNNVTNSSDMLTAFTGHVVGATIAASSDNGANYIGDPKMVTLTANSGTASQPVMYNGPGNYTSGNYYIGVDAKAGTNNYAVVEWRYDPGSGTPTDVSVVFDLTDGSVGQTSVATGTAGTATLVYAGSEYLGNGVYRLHVVANTGISSSNYLNFYMAKAKTGNTVSATNVIVGNWSGTETVLFQNFDLQAGSTPCSNIRTTVAAATRSGDILSTTDSGLLAATAWEIETGEVQIASGAAATLIGINTGIGIGVTSSGAVTTADGGAQTTANTGTWTGDNRAGIAWTP
jgi:hypothetical protein